MKDLSDHEIEYEVASAGAASSSFLHACPDDCVTLALPLYVGRSRIETDDSILFEGRVMPGMMRLGFPGEQIRITLRSFAKALFLKVPRREYDRIVSEFGDEADGVQRSGIRSIIGPNPHVKALVSAILADSGMAGPRRQAFLAGLVQSLLAVLIEAQVRGEDASEHPDGPGLAAEQVRVCRDYAEDRLGQGVDLHDWADLLGLTASEFSRRFHASTGSAPYAWFLERRIERAQDLLATTGKSLVEVALDLGFCSQSHFTQAFHKRVGTSPARWRRSRAAGS